MGVKELVRKIRYKKGCMKVNQVIDKNKKPTMKRNTVAKKRERSVSRLQSEFEELGVTHLEVDNPDTHFNRARSSSRARPVEKMKKKHDKKAFAKMGKAGESDRKIHEKKPKHLFTGKRGIGKTDRR